MNNGSNGGPNDYWRANLRVMAPLLAVWFLVSYGLGIFAVEPLNEIRIGGFPLGFWFAQQGAIYVFIALIFAYAIWMDRVDRAHGVDEAAAKREAAAQEREAAAKREAAAQERKIPKDDAP